MTVPMISQWITKYVDLGWSLIPIKPRSKEPLIPWKEFQTRKASLEQITTWIAKWPDLNLGVVTGHISGLIVMDFDGIKGRNYLINKSIVGSVVSLTGNGKQVYYKWTEHVDNSASKIAPGVDIRGDGGFVVLPPSVHPNGKRYRWERFVPQSLTSLPVYLKVNDTTMPLQDSGLKKEAGWIAKALQEMRNGNIDTTLTSILGRMRRDGYSEADAKVLLQPHALQRGAADGHLEEKIRNIWSRYEPRRSESFIQSNYEQSDSNALSIHSPADDDSFNRFNDLQSTKRDLSLYIQTGFPTLDKMFEGGLKSERLFTVAALTGVGKTNFGIALSSNLCQQGKKVLYFSTEFQYQKVWSRYIATLDKPERFREHAFHVVDSFSPNIEQVEEAIKKVQPSVFVFDFIQHIGKEKEVLTAFMKGCQFLQRKYNTQGVILAQLNRHADFVENGKKIEPRLSMIEGSATLEQASSRVLLLQEVKVTPEMNEIHGYLAKNDSGDRGLIHFALMKNPYKLVELL